MQRRLIFSEGEFYHLYNRGVEKRRIFTTEKDYKRFIRLLYLANSDRRFVFRDVERTALSEIDRGEPLVAIGAYVLMPNHFHILVKEIKPGGISAFMEKLLTGYAAYFNKSHDRTGRLFQSTFQARHASRDEYLKYLFAYIHLNPIKLVEPAWKEAGIKNKAHAQEYLAKFQYSSYLDYVDENRAEGIILMKNEFPEYFSEQNQFSDFHDDWLSCKDINT